MGESWVKSHTGKCVQNLQAVNSSDTAYDSHVSNNWGGFSSRAYVNPCIVKCATSYSNASTVTVPKRIHINPYFKGNRTFLQNQKTQKETNFVHINPYFARSNVLSPKKEQLHQALSSSCNQLNDIVTGDKQITNTIRKSHKKNLNKSVDNKSYSPDINFACTQYTSSRNHIDGAVSKCEKSSSQSSQSVSQIYKRVDIGGKSVNIKTRHKLVRVKLEAHCSIGNNDRKLLNRYKLVNVKTKTNEEKSENSDFERKINIIKNVESSAQKEVIQKMFVENLNLFKLKHNLKKNSSVNKITNSIKTKYMYQNKTWLRKRLINSSRNSRHKMDKREMSLKTCHNQKKVLTKTVPHHKVKSISLTWKSPASKHKCCNDFVWRKQGKLVNDAHKIKKAYPNRTVVKIGGIMYKSSSNKLTRARDKNREMKNGNVRNYTTSKMRHQIVYVRGEKFLLDSSGKTLIRQPKVVNTTEETKSCVKRIDLGGVTFIQKSNNILIRTNTHQARQLVHSAKQRSIALLQHLRKRNNMPCMIYQRFGICRRHKSGMCIYVHDPKNIDLCKKFLKGECHNSNCQLSHNAVKEKVATCHFFLKGKCNKENCPYLHVKVNKKAVICRDFLQGFCNLGQNCTKRHVHRCPEFEEKGICSRSVNCPYPHKTSTKRKAKSSKSYEITKFRLTKRTSPVAKKGTLQEKVDCKTLKKNNLRTKREISRKKKTKMESGQLIATDAGETDNDSVVECIPKRVKLTDLPLFIPLNDK